MGTPTYASKHKSLGLCVSCPKPFAPGSRLFCEYHREKSRARGREKDKRLSRALKKECFEHYGSSCSCCSETIFEFLTIEHIGGKGNVHRKNLFKHNVGGFHMYRWLKKNNYPSGYTILCMNCNWAQRLGSICPHKKGEVA